MNVITWEKTTNPAAKKMIKVKKIYEKNIQMFERPRKSCSIGV